MYCDTVMMRQRSPLCAPLFACSQFWVYTYKAPDDYQELLLQHKAKLDAAAAAAASAAAAGAGAAGNGGAAEAPSGKLKRALWLKASVHVCARTMELVSITFSTAVPGDTHGLKLHSGLFYSKRSQTQPVQPVFCP